MLRSLVPALALAASFCAVPAFAADTETSALTPADVEAVYFRALAFYLKEKAKSGNLKPENEAVAADA